MPYTLEVYKGIDLMKLFIGGLIALMLSLSVGAEPLLEGQVRLSSGQPAVGVQVRLFDLTNLRRFIGTTTDETGYFALIFASVSTDKGTALPTSFSLVAKLSQSVQSFDHYSLSDTGVHACALGGVQPLGAAAGDVSGCGTVGGGAHGTMGWNGCGGGGLWERGCTSIG